MRPLESRKNWETTMLDEAAIDRIHRDLREALDHMRSDLDHVELLAAALGIFSRLVPNYEPRFHHLHRLENAQELDIAAAKRQ
jgi:hypothetical protein